MSRNFRIIVLLFLFLLFVLPARFDLIYAADGEYPDGPTCSKLSTAKWGDMSLYDLTYGCIPAGWSEFFQTDDVRQQVRNISDAIDKQVEDNYKISPAIGRVFRALYFVKPSKVRSVIMGQDPAPQPGLATGLAFSTEPHVDSAKVASIQRVLLEAQNEGFCVDLKNGDLENWAQNGVLLLNMALSIPCPPDEESCTIGGHIALWGIFSDRLTKYIDKNAGAASFILWGSKAGSYAKNVKNSIHKVLKGGHPSPRVSGEDFFCKNYFNCTNKWLKENNQEPVNWNLISSCSKSTPCVWAWHKQSDGGYSTCKAPCTLSDCDFQDVSATGASAASLLGNKDPEIVSCKKLKSSGNKACSVSKGGSSLLISGNILAPSKIYVGGDVLVKDGMIACVGCDCSNSEENPTKIICPNSVVSPGLINAHDHLNYDQSFPGKWGTERFDQRNDWRLGKRGHTKLSYESANDSKKVTWSELRQLMSGTTSIAGSSGSKGILRNIDKTGLQEGLTTVKVANHVFPLGDGSTGTQLETGCGYPNIDGRDVIDKNDCYLPHIAEGVDNVAHNEFLCVSGQQEGAANLVSSKSAFIHAIPLNETDAKILRDNKTTVVWAPRSNVALYGKTAPVNMYDSTGVNVALSTDWTISGSMNLLRELKCVDSLNKKYFGKYFSDWKIWRMVTANAALGLAVGNQIGFLQPNYVADIAIFKRKSSSDYCRAVIKADWKDTALVLRAGVPLYGDKYIMSALTNAQDECEDIVVKACSAKINKTGCVKKDTGFSFQELADANKDSYPLYYCAAPADEPTCVPTRMKSK